MTQGRKPGLVAILGGLAAVVALLTGGCDARDRPASTTEAVTFAILSAEDQASAEPLWRPLLDDLSRALGVPVEARFGSTYAELVDGMVEGRIQAGWFSARPAIEAVDRAGAEILTRTVGRDGSDSYRAVLIGGPGVTLERVLACDRTLTLALGDAQSTSATLAPMTYLFTPRGIDPARCFREVRSGNHQANAFAVAAGTVDVAAVNTPTLAAMGRQNAHLADQVSELWRSPPIPEGAILARADLDPTLREKMRSFFLTYGQGDSARAERERGVLSAIGYSQFRAADVAYLDPVREMIAAETLAQARASGDRRAIQTAEQAVQRLKARREVLP